MKPPGPKGCLLIVCSSLDHSAGLNSTTIRLGASAASFSERIIGSLWKPVFSAKAPNDLAIRTRAEDLAGHISADRRYASEPPRIVRERPRVRQHRLADADGPVDLRRLIVLAKP
jgi:hypothetical protein